MSYQTSILDLPPEILRMIFQRVEFETTEDLRNFLAACKVYTDPRISNILSQINVDNEGMLFYRNFIYFSYDWGHFYNIDISILLSTVGAV